MTIDLRHITYFLAVAEEGGFTRAAERVGIQQPPLSQQIKALEQTVGTPLFRRTAKGAEVTEAGRAFQLAVTAIPDQIARAIREAQRAARGERGSIKLGYTGSAAFNPKVAKAIRTFRTRYPDVEMVLSEANTPRLVSGTVEGSYDAVFLRPGSEGSDALQLRHVADEPMVAVLPSDHPEAAQKAVNLANLRHDSFVLLPYETGPVLYHSILSACREAGFEPRLGQAAPQIGSIVNLVAVGLGVSLVPASMSCLKVVGVVFRDIAGDVPRVPIALGHRKGPASAVLLNLLKVAS